MRRIILRLHIIIAIVSVLGIVGIARAQTATTLECGDIVEGETSANQQVLDYSINVRAGTTLNGRVEPIGSSFNVYLSFIDTNGQVFHRVNRNAAGIAEVVENFIVSSSNPILRVSGTIPNHANDIASPTTRYVGAFTIYLGCTLRDGTVIPPGLTAISEGEPPQPPPQPPVPSFGFPGVGPVDFSSGIELPLQPGLPQVAPVGGDVVALYTFNGGAGQSNVLNISRASGDISIGVAVIHRDTNEIVFLGGMPSSNSLIVELAFPFDGDYVVGIFQLNTPTKTGTSGAVQVSLSQG